MLSDLQCESIRKCLLLFCNILHLPENGYSYHDQQAMLNQILWNLFTQGIGEILIHLMSCPQRAFCIITIAQLIMLMLKDQRIPKQSHKSTMNLESIKISNQDIVVRVSVELHLQIPTDFVLFEKN